MKKILYPLVCFLFGYEAIMAQWDSVGQVEPNIVFTSPHVAYYYYNETGGTPSNPTGIGHLYKSTDTWNTWTEIYSIGSWTPWNVGRIWGLQFINDSVGCICSNLMSYGGLSHSTDGGASWKSIAGGLSDIPFSFLRADYGYYKAYGPAGNGFYLYDHGQSTKQDSTFAGVNYLLDILLFINDSIGFLIPHCYSPQVYRTIDYGKTWELSGDAGIAKKIIFPHMSKGFYLNTSSDLYSTTDLGATWTLVGRIPLSPVIDLFFLDSLTGWAAGNDGQILKTTSGGVSWEVVPAASTDDITRIQFFSESIGYYISIHHYQSSEAKYILYRTHAGPWGIIQTDIRRPLKIVQNPVRSKLVLSFNTADQQITFIDIVTLKRQVVFHSDKFLREIDVSSFAPGIYFLRYKTLQGTFSEKFIVPFD